MRSKPDGLVLTAVDITVRSVQRKIFRISAQNISAGADISRVVSLKIIFGDLMERAAGI